MIAAGIATLLILTVSGSLHATLAAEAGRVEYRAEVVAGSGLSVSFTGRPGVVRVRYQVPVVRTAKSGDKSVRLVKRSLQVRLRQSGAKALLPLDAVFVQARLGSGWTDVAVTPQGPAAIAIAGGGSHSCALLADGTVKCWGSNSHGQLGDGTYEPRTLPVTVVGLSGVRQIVADGDSSCAVLADGSVRCWGDNSNGSLGDGTTTGRPAPAQVVGVSGAEQLLGLGCAREVSGAVKCWDGPGATGQPAPFTAVEVPEWAGATYVRHDGMGYPGRLCALTAMGSVSCLMDRDEATLYSGSDPGTRVAVVPLLGLSGVTQLASGIPCALRSDGEVVCWSWTDEWAAESGLARTGTVIAGFQGARAISGQYDDVLCALLGSGRVSCTHVGTVSQIAKSMRVVVVSGATAIVRGCARMADTTVSCWGPEGRGERVTGLGDVKDMLPGVALLADGTVRAWGNEVGGLLGDGTTIDRHAPVVVTGVGSAWRPGPAVARQPFTASEALTGSWSTTGTGRLLVRVSGGSPLARLSYHVGLQARQVIMTMSGGMASRSLPSGANTIQAQPLTASKRPAGSSVFLAGPPGGQASALSPTGMLLAGTPSPDATTLAHSWPPLGRRLVADDSGAIWASDGGRLTRIDPATGAVQTWDGSADITFAAMALLAPAPGGAVWLASRTTLRRFDGRQFTDTLSVPEQLLATSRGPNALGTIRHMVDTGSSLYVSVVDVVWDSEWMSTHHPKVPTPAMKVLRWSGGAWHPTSTSKQGVGGSLALDRRGTLWAGGSFDQLLSGGLHTLAGRAWRRSSAPPILEYPRSGVPIADPTGGIWLADILGGGWLHFDGHRWRHVVDGAVDFPTSSSDPGYPGPVPPVAVDPRGRAWFVSGGKLMALTRQGKVSTYGTDQGLVGTAIGGPVLAGGRLYVADGVGVLRLDGTQLTRVAELPLDRPGLSRLAAAASDRVLANTEDRGGTWYLGTPSGWTAVGKPNATYSSYSTCPAVVASDGAIWTSDGTGLIRVLGDGQTAVVAPGSRDCPRAPATDGGVWVEVKAVGKDPRRYELYLPDGSHHAVAQPDGPDSPCEIDGTAGRDGVLVVDLVSHDCGDEGESRGIAVWDGNAWSRLPAPPDQGPYSDGAYVDALVLSEDRSIWAQVNGSQVVRYQAGNWQTIVGAGTPGVTTTRYSGMVAAPGNQVCLREESWAKGSAVVCLSPAGEVARFDTTGLGVREVSVSPDGYIWVLGPQAARLGHLG